VRVLVIGGTGMAGRHVVAELVRRGHEVRVLSRRGGDAGVTGAEGRRGDVETGGGLAEALAGVEVVVDSSNVKTIRRQPAERQFVQGTRRLLAAEADAGVRHHVLLSIVGIDGVPYPYYEVKVRQEQLAGEGPVPATVLRATQFHEFVPQVAGYARLGPLLLAPRMLMQPVSLPEVAAALADAVEAPPAGRAPDVAGPRREQFPDLARRWLRSLGRRAVVVPVSWPGRAGRMMRAGVLLPGPGARLGSETFDTWLERQTGAQSESPGARS
jgi:uncharacterized protein YbjT (DUF2867 family)